MTHGLKRSTTAGTMLLLAGLFVAACGNSAGVDQSATTSTSTGATTDNSSTPSTTESAVETTTTSSTTVAEEATAESIEFQIEVWADNWSAVYINGQLVGEDSVPITTERSFNAETFDFEATFPFTVAIEAKDFKETDSGIEYIGENNQQMGDGGIIAQITNVETGEVVASTDSAWSALVIHRAPLNTECVNDADPDATCQFESVAAPDGWAEPDFDDSLWTAATEWSEGDVRPRDGYDEIDWDGDAALIWGSDLEIDNTVLLRSTITN